MAGSTASAALFFDTSAVVRRYQRSEPGAGRVRALCDWRSRNRLLLSRLGVTEVASALNRNVRTGAVSQAQRDRAWQLFGVHLRRQYHIVAVDEQVYRKAEELLFAHPLRAYDALQLAAALATARLIGGLGQFRFCTADRLQAQAARVEGLEVELIG